MNDEKGKITIKNAMCPAFSRNVKWQKKEHATQQILSCQSDIFTRVFNNLSEKLNEKMYSSVFCKLCQSIIDLLVEELVSPPAVKGD